MGILFEIEINEKGEILHRTTIRSCHPQQDTISHETHSSRPGKGCSLLEEKHDFTAIDIETTGLSFANDQIIDLGAVRYRDGRPVARFDQLVNPGHEIDPFITHLTGITNEMLEYAPPIKEALPEFLAFIGSDILLGHNVHFDINFIYDSCANLGFGALRNDFIDTLRIARNLYKDTPHSLDCMIHRLGMPPRSKHRAAEDAELAAELYLRMITEKAFDEKSYSVPKSRLRNSSQGLEPTMEVDPTCKLYGKILVFTGTLSLEREEAIQIAVNAGAVVRSSVSRKTDYLVVGVQDISLVGDDGMSSKEEKAHALNGSGQAHIEIINESQFMALAGACKRSDM